MEEMSVMVHKKSLKFEKELKQARCYLERVLYL